MAMWDIECKGCISYGIFDGEENHCDLKPYFKNKQCPCLTCIVKGICSDISVQQCKAVAEYNKHCFGDEDDDWE